jgi:anti-sigma B factor antagonist
MKNLRTEPKEGALVVQFADTKILDEGTIDQIGKEFGQACDQATTKKLLVNFRGVSFMSSAMIGKLVLLNKKCKSDGINLKLCGISENVMEVFKIMRLNKVFDIHKDEEKALKAFDKKGWFG